MKKLKLSTLAAGFSILFCLNLFGLMKLLPLFITSPLLFMAIFVLLLYLNRRNTFKGFHRPSARRRM
ncbi:hypothetical protein BpJC7_17710 [Weizmannia acidilactici]|uniref:Uncharacterized protein n=1 Tax=Weizmannia acidilactici TaxID=2607726 RepID=A0A5J4JJ08_9BACI|nr:hypothetical protein [Weizmannia acidilactici]GER67369.1 hypothetical protein BpJC4_18400 [Weizmannia acidilactici]GER70468.1 hypothetical protein BpJC7_17710 [Weizmannia acidilactici]GER72631.1 hypothetical protein BpPP18_06980 [Weizmannia acidilactici]